MTRHGGRLLAALVFLAGSGAPAGQGAQSNELANVKALKCVFPVYALGSWKNGVPLAQAKNGQLSIQIDSIDVQTFHVQMHVGLAAGDRNWS